MLAFQCSSASRKFLKHLSPHSTRVQFAFQCSSASRKFLKDDAVQIEVHAIPLFQCSSASRKFLKMRHLRAAARRSRVSVLFSEPKIPQTSSAWSAGMATDGFQCSSASRKFLKILGRMQAVCPPLRFSALQRAENSSKPATTAAQ